MARSDPKLKKLYRRINKRYFATKLPDSTVVRYDEELVAHPRSKKFGYGDSDTNDPIWVIRINPLLKGDWNSMQILTLMHEMCHLEEYRKHGRMSHGKAWEREMIRLAHAGAFGKHSGLSRNTIW